jgi:hypothetical protein
VWARVWATRLKQAYLVVLALQQLVEPVRLALEHLSVNRDGWITYRQRNPNPSECGGVAPRLCCLGSGASHE